MTNTQRSIIGPTTRKLFLARLAEAGTIISELSAAEGLARIADIHIRLGQREVELLLADGLLERVPGGVRVAAVKPPPPVEHQVPAPFPTLRITDLRHQQHGQIRLSEEKYGPEVANVFSRNERAAEWAALFRAAPLLLQVMHLASAEAAEQGHDADEETCTCSGDGKQVVRDGDGTPCWHILAARARGLLAKPFTEPTFIERLFQDIKGTT